MLGSQLDEVSGILTPLLPSRLSCRTFEDPLCVLRVTRRQLRWTSYFLSLSTSVTKTSLGLFCLHSCKEAVVLQSG